MKIIFLIITIIFFLFSCEKSPCDNLINGICPYPDISADLPVDQRSKALDLPEGILGCITTEGLVETCLNYPDFILIWTRNSLQDGYDYIYSRFNGLRELENRNDAPKFLLKKYLTINLQTDTLNLEPIEKGEYSFKICYLALVFCQYTYLKELTTEEKIEIIKKSLSLYYQLLNNHTVLLPMSPIVTLMGRLMHNDGYEPFMNIYDDADNNWLRHYLKICHQYGESINIIVNISADYLEHLNNE